jgi:integrase
MLVVKQFGEKEQSKGVKAPPVVYSDQVYLTPEEIQRLETHPFEPGSTDDICRDLFLCAYYTALRSCDWKQIRTSQIEILEGKKMLKVAQQKTKKKALIPVNPKLWAILKKHGGSTLKQYSQQFLNRNIKDICRRCGITDPVSIAEYRKGKITQIEGPKYQFVSSHTARRSFATNAVQAGIPATDVMRFTGHSTMAAFMQYIRTTREETALKYADHEFFGRIIAVPEKELTEEILKARQSAAAEFAGMLTSPPELDPEEMEWAGIA